MVARRARPLLKEFPSLTNQLMKPVVVTNLRATMLDGVDHVQVFVPRNLAPYDITNV
jgi:hypothetical protein